MQSRIATLLLVAMMVVALLLAGRWQGADRSPAPSPLQAASPENAQAAVATPLEMPEPRRLDTLRRSTESQAVEETQAAPTPADLDDALWEKLQKPISVSFTDTPLTEVTTYFADAIDTQILLDLRALEDAAIPKDLPITIELSNLPAEAVLDVLLRQHDLDYRLHSGALIVTTAEVAAFLTKVRTYPVADLVGHDYELLDELVETVNLAIAPDAWSDNGGPGQITTFDRTLVITQTDKIHREIQQLLRQLRAAQHAAGAKP